MCGTYEGNIFITKQQIQPANKTGYALPSYLHLPRQSIIKMLQQVLGPLIKNGFETNRSLLDCIDDSHGICSCDRGISVFLSDVKKTSNSPSNKIIILTKNQSKSIEFQYTQNDHNNFYCTYLASL